MTTSSHGLRQQIAIRSLSHPKHQSPKIVHFSKRLWANRPAFIRAMATKQPPFLPMPPAQMLVQGLFLSPPEPVTPPLSPFSPLPLSLCRTQLHLLHCNPTKTSSLSTSLEQCSVVKTTNLSYHLYNNSNPTTNKQE
jgi:hypothetical protein